MNESDRTVLRGLPGNNPLGFLAALGVQTALYEQGYDNRLHWTDGPIPYPVVTPASNLQEIAKATKAVAARWLEGPALDEATDPTLKLKPPAIREYLIRGREAGAAGVLAHCLLAEDSLDNNSKAKPSDLYFTAGNQAFVSMARSILGDVTDEEIIDDLAEPWRYQGKGVSLMWDTVDDRDHALSPSDPSKTKKMTNPGAEVLALIGLSRYPCFASPHRTLTQGCSGAWKRGTFVWPLWNVPASVSSVGSLLAQIEPGSCAVLWVLGLLVPVGWSC